MTTIGLVCGTGEGTVARTVCEGVKAATNLCKEKDRSEIAVKTEVVGGMVTVTVVDAVKED